ncbi:hypothetical protein ACWY4P_19585 [Streptomyces sp. LZ34]
MHLCVASCSSSELRAWTGLSGPQLKMLITWLWHRRPTAAGDGPWALAYADRVLPVTLACRTNLTMLQMGFLFGDSAVHRTIADLAPHLAALLDPPPTDRRELWLVDGTLIPVHDKKRTAKSMNYRRSVNAQVMCRARDRRVVAVAEHALARLKGHQVLRQCRRKGDSTDHAITGVAVLHNLELEITA